MRFETTPTRVSRAAAGTLADVRALGFVEAASFLVLSVAAWSAYAAPTAVGYFDEDAYTSIWNARPIASANVFELGVVVVAVGWLVRALRRRRERWSALDSHVAAFSALVAILVLVALQRAGATAVYEKFDLERLVLFGAGYLLISRLSLRPRTLAAFAFVLAALFLVHFAAITIQHGIVGSTEFATVAGRLALLITEDAVLVGVGLTVLWGLYADGLIRRSWYGPLVAVLIVVVVTVDFLSYRRGALLLVGGMLALRSTRSIRRLAVVGVLAALAALGASEIVAGPRPSETAGPPPRALTSDSRPQPTSSAFVDASTRQRTAELSNYTRNVSGPFDVAVGRGLGAAWNAEVLGPVDVASYGGGETAYVRVGWHVFGLDWLYKVGIVGIVGLLALGAHAVLVVLRGVRHSSDAIVRSVAWSALAVAPFLFIMLFTNARLAVFAGVAVGLASKAVDVTAD